jgi:endonuclease/exonuclease/phosphatase family metal-dependent hydrolase
MLIINRIFWMLNIVAGLLLLLSYAAPYIDPLIWWVIAFLGLAFPFLFLLNILFAAFWLIQGKLKLIFSLACLLLGYSHYSKIYKLSGETMKEDTESIRIVSMNVKGFGYSEKKPYLDSFVEYLQEEKADIVCIQEFLNKDLGQKEDVSSFIRKKTGLSSSNRKKTGHGTAIFSRFPTVASGSISFGKNTLNGAVWADVAFPSGQIIRVYSVHLQSNHLTKKEQLSVKDIEHQEEAVKKSKNIIKRLKNAFEKRSEQLDTLLEHINDCKHPVIIAGDLNDTQLSYTYRKLRGKRTDAFVESGEGAGNTYVGPFPSYRIDYMFYDPVIKSYGYASGPHFGSDHKLIKAQLTLEN